MPVEFYKGSPGKFDPRTLNRKTLTRWTGRTTTYYIILYNIVLCGMYYIIRYYIALCRWSFLLKPPDATPQFLQECSYSRRENIYPPYMTQSEIQVENT